MQSTLTHSHSQSPPLSPLRRRTRHNTTQHMLSMHSTLNAFITQSIDHRFNPFIWTSLSLVPHYHPITHPMRPLTDDETVVLFEKLTKYIGDNVRLLITRPDGVYCFRLHSDRVFYCSENMIKLASNISRDNLISFGTCFGKFTKSKKFRLHMTALDFLAPYAKHKVWLKPNAEQQFLYGNHVLKSGLGRITEGTPQYQGVIVYSMNDLPLGFGATAKSALDCRNADPMTIVMFHQSDIGEYLRNEDNLV